MKPYGREKVVRFACKQDCHPPKGWINWWEDMCGLLSRTAIKAKWKKELKKELNERYQ